MVAVEVSLNKWLYNAIVACEVLTLNRGYFRLSGGLERGLYELARKHCGNQTRWKVSMDVLHKKSGSQLRGFSDRISWFQGSKPIKSLYKSSSFPALMHTP
jgi:plasmid replication initiation protein